MTIFLIDKSPFSFSFSSLGENKISLALYNSFDKSIFFPSGNS